MKWWRLQKRNAVTGTDHTNSEALWIVIKRLRIRMFETDQLPDPPIIAGITIKKIIKGAWAVIKTLYSWWFPPRIWSPGRANSIRISTEKHVPITPAMAPKMKYRVPISLWLVENSHRTGFVVKLRLFRFLPYQRGALRERGLLKKGECGASTGQVSDSIHRVTT